jgi:hypothetical protein
MERLVKAGRARSVGILESEALIASLAAGGIFGALEILSALAVGSPLWPIEAAASLLMRERAYYPEYLALAIPMGIAVHVSLTIVYGFGYGIMSSDARLATRLSPSREAGIGFIFGACIWLLNFQLVARLFYPWLVETNQFVQLLLHAGGFGTVLALLFRRKELRRVNRMISRY